MAEDGLIVRVSFVCGVATSLFIDVERDPVRFRSHQRSIIQRLTLPGWSVCAPELYADPPEASRDPDGDLPHLRAWTAEAVGTTRLPVGFARTVSADDEAGSAQPIGSTWTPTRRHVTVWPDRAAVSCLDYVVRVSGPGEFDRLRERTDEQRDEMTATAVAAPDRVVAGLLPLLDDLEIAYDHGEEPCRHVGRHRLFRIDATPSAALINDAKVLALLGDSDEYRDVCPDEGWFARPGSGMSVEIGLDPDGTRSVLDPIARYFEYWITAVATADDALHAHYTALTRSDDNHDRTPAIGEEHARLLFFAHQDVLAAMSPQHRAAWEGYYRSWALEELERDVLEKVAAVEELGRQIRERRANAIAFRTTLVVTLLTALTLVSIATGIAVFIIAERDLGYPLRIATVISSTIGAVALFMVSIRPSLWGGRTRSSRSGN